jgi:hydroxyacylglutathione hydrolase
MSVKKIIKDGVPTLVPQSKDDVLNFELIDVRRPDEFVGELGHIQGAKLFTLGPELENYLLKANKEKATLFICRSGARSANATLFAIDLGFKDVYNLEGGMILWNNLNLPIEK